MGKSFQYLVRSDKEVMSKIVGEHTLEKSHFKSARYRLLIEGRNLGFFYNTFRFALHFLSFPQFKNRFIRYLTFQIKKN